MHDNPIDPPYAPARTSRRLWWILGALGVTTLVLGMCVKGGVDLFSAIAERSAASVELAKKFTSEGLPPSDDPLYARRSGVTEEAIETVNRLMAQYGTVTDFSDAACSMNTAANTDAAQSGTSADCFLSAKAKLSPVNIGVRWVREDETWKLLAFNLNYTDQTLLLEKAEELDRRATEEGGSVEEPPSEDWTGD